MAAFVSWKPPHCPPAPQGPWSPAPSPASPFNGLRPRGVGSGLRSNSPRRGAGRGSCRRPGAQSARAAAAAQWQEPLSAAVDRAAARHERRTLARSLRRATTGLHSLVDLLCRNRMRAQDVNCTPRFPPICTLKFPPSSSSEAQHRVPLLLLLGGWAGRRRGGPGGDRRRPARAGGSRHRQPGASASAPASV